MKLIAVIRATSIFEKSGADILWQGRFASFPMAESYLLAAARYVEQNPVKAEMVNEAWDYAWSSVHAYLSGKSDGIVTVEPMQSRVDNWKEFIAASSLSDEGCFRSHERTGRPLGDEGFVRQVSKLVGRDLMPRKPGRKKKEK